MTQRVTLLAVAIAFLAIGFFARTPDTGGVPMRDFEAYYAAGATWHYHNDPYSRDIWRTERHIPGVIPEHDEILPFVGPPFGLPLWDALSRLPWPAAANLWRAIVSLAFVAIVLGSVRIAGGNVDRIDLPAAFVFAATFSPLTSGAALGQAALLACAAIVMTPLLLRVKYAYASGFGAAVAGLQPNLAIVLAARLREPRTWIAFLGAAALAIGGSEVALSAYGGIAHYLGVLHDQADAERFIAIQMTTGAVARGLGAEPRTAGTLALCIAVAVFATLCVQWFRGRYAPNDMLVLACAAAPLALPFAHAHDLDIAFFAAIVVLRRARGIAWLIAAAAAIGVGVDWLGLVQRPGSTVEAIALATASGCALIVLGRFPSRRMLALPIAAAACIALVAIPASHHVLATWPNGLPPHFHMPRTASAAEVWGAEQTATGVAAIDPYWSLLRLLSLAGCAILWAVASYVFSGSRSSEPLSTPSRPRAAAYPSDAGTSRSSTRRRSRAFSKTRASR